MATTDKVNMQVRDGLARCFSLIDHEPVAVKPLLLRDLSGSVQKVLMVPHFRDLCHTGNLLPCDDENMGGSDRSDVSKRDTVLIFIKDVAGDFPIDDSSEEGHSSVWQALAWSVPSCSEPKPWAASSGARSASRNLSPG